MTGKIDTLFFYTAAFPYGKGEEFIEKELPVLAKRFARIYIVPETSFEEGTVCRPLPGNVQVINITYPGKKGYLKLMARKPALFLSLLISEMARFPALYKRRQYFLFIYFRACHLEGLLPGYPIDNAYHYAYWMSAGALALSLLKREGKIKHFLFRVHGHDIYNDRNRGYIPFREFCYKYTDAVITISRHGLNYLHENYPAFSEKYHCEYLGVEDRGLNPQPVKGPFVIFSCSSLIPLKRVHLIAETLSLVRSEVRWIHIGDGPEKDRVKKVVANLPSNVLTEFPGHMSNQELMALYKKESTDIFLHLSSAEGLPVSIMEAISFGIPVIATDVGGVSEIVNTQTGILLDADPDINELAALIDNLALRTGTAFDRNAVRQFWQNNFDANRNYNHFVQTYFTTPESRQIDVNLTGFYNDKPR